MYDLNMIVPDITSPVYTDDNKFRLLKNYLYELNETLSYALSDRVESDITSVSVQMDKDREDNSLRIQQLSAKSIKRFNELKEQILRTAEDIEKEYTVLVEQKENEILQSVEGTYVAQSQFGEYKNTTDTAIKQNADNIALVSENVDEVNDGLSVFKETTRSEMAVQSDSILSRVEEIYATKSRADDIESRVSSQIVQSAENITENFSRSLAEVNEDITTVGGSFAEFVSDLDVYIRRGELEENVYGIEIGRSDSNIKARFTNDRLSFYQGITEVAFVSGSSLYITNAQILDFLKIGNSSDGYFMFDMTGNGLEVRWINGD